MTDLLPYLAAFAAGFAMALALHALTGFLKGRSIRITDYPPPSITEPLAFYEIPSPQSPLSPYEQAALAHAAPYSSPHIRPSDIGPSPIEAHTELWGDEIEAEYGQGPRPNGNEAHGDIASALAKERMRRFGR